MLLAEKDRIVGSQGVGVNLETAILRARADDAYGHPDLQRRSGEAASREIVWTCQFTGPGPRLS